MLFAMSTPPALTPLAEVSLVQSYISSSPITLSQGVSKRSVNLDYLYHVLLEKKLHLDSAILQLSNNKLILTVPLQIFTDLDEMILDREQAEQMENLGYLLNNLSNKIAIRTATQFNNVEKSLGISAQIANTLQKGGYSDPIPILTYFGDENKPQIDILIYPFTKGGLL